MLVAVAEATASVVATVYASSWKDPQQAVNELTEKFLHEQDGVTMMADYKLVGCSRFLAQGRRGKRVRCRSLVEDVRLCNVKGGKVNFSFRKTRNWRRQAQDGFPMEMLLWSCLLWQQNGGKAGRIKSR